MNEYLLFLFGHSCYFNVVSINKIKVIPNCYVAKAVGTNLE